MDKNSNQPKDFSQPRYFTYEGRYAMTKPGANDGKLWITIFPRGSFADFMMYGQEISKIEYETASELHGALHKAGIPYADIVHALELASSAHWDQTRKTDDTPYITHPISVATILTAYTKDPDILNAALCHDVLEDTDTRPDHIRWNCNERVLELVQEVSEPKVLGDRKASWQERKEKYLAHLTTASEGALLICAADKIHNLRSMIGAHNEQGDAIWTKFNSPADKKLWFYGEVLKILTDRLSSPIVSELQGVYNDAVRLFGTESDTMGTDGPQTK